MSALKQVDTKWRLNGAQPPHEGPVLVIEPSLIAAK
jgi:hypothetical protein